MIKFTNFIACAATAAIFFGLATNTIDQEIVRRSLEGWFWLPTGWFGVAAVNNIREY